jgi:hypothetical protein
MASYHICRSPKVDCAYVTIQFLFRHSGVSKYGESPRDIRFGPTFGGLLRADRETIRWVSSSRWLDSQDARIRRNPVIGLENFCRSPE